MSFRRRFRRLSLRGPQPEREADGDAPNCAERQAAARGQWRTILFELLAVLAPNDETWFGELAVAATGEKPTDAPANEVARLLGLHRKVPGASLPDLVAMLAHPTYGAVAGEILANLPRLAHEPLMAGLKAVKPADRAAAATILGKTAALTRTDPISREQWRAAEEALAALAVNDPDADVKVAAAFARKALAKGRP